MNKKHKNCKYQHKGFLPGTTARKHVSENPAKMGSLYCVHVRACLSDRFNGVVVQSLLSLQVLCVEVERDVPIRSLVPVRHDSLSFHRLIHLQPARQYNTVCS